MAGTEYASTASTRASPVFGGQGSLLTYRPIRGAASVNWHDGRIELMVTLPAGTDRRQQTDEHDQPTEKAGR